MEQPRQKPTEPLFLRLFYYFQVRKVVKKKKLPFIKKLEIAGQCTLHGLQFLERKAHTELEKRLGTAIPEMEVDCSEIYYCF